MIPLAIVLLALVAGAATAGEIAYDCDELSRLTRVEYDGRRRLLHLAFAHPGSASAPSSSSAATTGRGIRAAPGAFAAERRKGQPFEGGQRVPTLMAWPGTLPAGQTLDAPAMNFDLFPTLLALAGLAPPLDRVIDGRDLWPLLSGAQTESRTRASSSSTPT